MRDTTDLGHLYLSNSTDDIIVNVSLLQSDVFSTFNLKWWGFLFGIQVGALITCGIAYSLLLLGAEMQAQLKESSILHKISDYTPIFAEITIIIVGIMVLLNYLPTQ